MSTTNSRTTRSRLWSATLVTAGTTLGIAIAEVIRRQERQEIVYAALVGALAFAVALALAWKHTPTVTVPVLPAKRRPSPRPVPGPVAHTHAELVTAQPREVDAPVRVREIESATR